MNYKRLLRDILVAILSALLTFFTASCMSSCAGGIVMGNRTSLTQKVNSSVDSTSIQLPSITIR